MKKNSILKIICAIIAVLCIAAVVIFVFVNSKNESDNKKFIENEIIELETDAYKGIFCSMYPITNYMAGDFETYAGVKTYKSSVKAEGLKEISQYLDAALDEDSQVTHVFLGLEPYKIWESAKRKDTKWEENWQKYLISYITENTDVTFQIMLPYLSMADWLSLDTEAVQERLEAYENMVTLLSSYDNVI